ncbi:protein SPMIP1 [Platichthys flesus]|uniref:protein SPMIP1 n=1 Tax=Platichthys flesus TaxID=8260 RepID=UPI002DBD2CF7|nr:protein SPMIP1 [Platichthys flesus]
MRGLFTTQSQNCYREQIQKEMMTRLSWTSRYATSHTSGCRVNNQPSTEAPQRPAASARPRAALPPVPSAPKKRQSDLPPPSPPPPPPPVDGWLSVAPAMRPVSPRSSKALYQDSSHNGKGRRLYLQRRGRIPPEEKFEFPLLSSWEYGWRLGDFTLDYRTPCRARSSVVRNTFFSRNGVFSSSSATDTLGSASATRGRC